MTYLLMTWYGDGDEPQLQTALSGKELYELIAVADSRLLRYRVFRLFVDEDGSWDLVDEEDNPI